LKWLSGLAAVTVSDGVRVDVADAENSPIRQTEGSCGGYKAVGVEIVCGPRKSQRKVDQPGLEIANTNVGN
jgi:hypothetical protein